MSDSDAPVAPAAPAAAAPVAPAIVPPVAPATVPPAAPATVPPAAPAAVACVPTAGAGGMNPGRVLEEGLVWLPGAERPAVTLGSAGPDPANSAESSGAPI